MRSEWDRIESASSERCRARVRGGASWEIVTWVRQRWQHTSGYPVSEKEKEGLARVLRVQTLSQHETIHGSGRSKGVVVRSTTGSRRAPPPARVAMAVFLHTEDAGDSKCVKMNPLSVMCCLPTPLVHAPLDPYLHTSDCWSQPWNSCLGV